MESTLPYVCNCCEQDGPCFGDVVTHLYLWTGLKGPSLYDVTQERSVTLDPGSYCIQYIGGATQHVQPGPDVWSIAFNPEIDLQGNGVFTNTGLSGNLVIPAIAAANWADAEAAGRHEWTTRYGDGLKLDWDGGELLFKYRDLNAVAFADYYQGYQPLGDIAATFTNGPKFTIRG